MTTANLENRLTLVTGGTDSNKIRALVRSRPFTQQIDVVFPSNPALRNALEQQQAAYRQCHCTLADFVAFAKPNVAAPESKFVALGLPRLSNDDVWCIDSRGVLTLAVCKETYETLGIVGDKLPWKQEIHVIRVSLSDAHTTYRQTTQTARYGTKVAEALRAWDARRGGPWNVAFFLTNLSSDVHLPLNTTSHQLERTVHTRPNTHIPTLNKAGLLIDSNTNTPEDIEDWEERVSSIFEWVGMAALGSQRLSAADRCDPYIAVYTPPERSYIEELTVMRWTAGLVPSTFVQAVLDTIMSPNIPWPTPGFVSITAHSVPTSPVTYVPPDPAKKPPVRAPRAESEDTWSVLCARDDSADAAAKQGSGWWVLAESVGKWDRRWG